jgi:hypothetical protein
MVIGSSKVGNWNGWGDLDQTEQRVATLVRLEEKRDPGRSQQAVYSSPPQNFTKKDFLTGIEARTGDSVDSLFTTGYRLQVWSFSRTCVR